MKRRWAAPSPMVRVGILVASGVLLTGAALWAASVGPWTGRVQSTSNQSLPTLDLPTFDPPTVRAVDPPAAAPSSSSFDPTLILLILGGILLVALILVAASVIRNRVPPVPRTRPDALVDDEVPVAPVVPDPDRPFDPRQAADYVIACWDQVEQQALRGGSGRRPEQTPTEFMEALKSSHPLDDRAAADLLTLYQRARFDHVRLLPDTAVRAGAAAQQLLGALGVLRQGRA